MQPKKRGFKNKVNLFSSPKIPRLFYTLSVKSLLSLEILLWTLRSMVRSPTSTTKPPRISGLILVTVLSFLPWLYSDLAMAVSRRWRVLGSSFYMCVRNQESARVSSRDISSLRIMQQKRDLFPYSSTCNCQFQLSSRGTDQGGELLGHAL